MSKGLIQVYFGKDEEGLASKAKAAAKADGRSLSGWIVSLVRKEINKNKK